MPVYDVAGAQQLARPATAFAEGKATRLALKSQELQNRAAQQEIDAFPDEQRRADERIAIHRQNADTAEQNAMTALVNAQTSYAKEIRQQSAQELEESKRELAGALSVYKSAQEAGEDAKAATRNYILSTSDDVSEEEIEQMFQAGEAVGGFDRLVTGLITTTDEVLKDSGTSYGKSPKIGINPNTGEREFFVQGDDGTPKFTGVQPPPDVDSSQRERKISDAQRLYGISEEKATGLVDGWIETEINEKTGKVLLKDSINNKVTELPISSVGGMEDGVPDVVKPENGGPSLWETADIATGAGSGLRSVWNDLPVISQLNPAVKTEIARSQMKQSTQALVKALANNPRYAATEMERIRKEVDLEPAFFDNPTAMRARMIGTSQYLSQELRENTRLANDPNAPDDLRSNAMRAKEDIERYLAKLGVPENAEAQLTGEATLDPDIQALVDQYAD